MMYKSKSIGMGMMKKDKDPQNMMSKKAAMQPELMKADIPGDLKMLAAKKRLKRMDMMKA